MDLSLRGLSGLELLKAIQIDTVSVCRWIWLKVDSQVLCRLADMIRALQVFAKKIFLTDVRLPAIAVIVLLFFALMDRIPDKPSLFKEGGLRSTQSLHVPAGFGEPGIAA